MWNQVWMLQTPWRRLHSASFQGPRIKAPLGGLKQQKGILRLRRLGVWNEGAGPARAPSFWRGLPRLCQLLGLAGSPGVPRPSDTPLQCPPVTGLLLPRCPRLHKAFSFSYEDTSDWIRAHLTTQSWLDYICKDPFPHKVAFLGTEG